MIVERFAPTTVEGALEALAREIRVDRERQQRAIDRIDRLEKIAIMSWAMVALGVVATIAYVGQ